MTQADWLTYNDPQAMLIFLQEGGRLPSGRHASARWRAAAASGTCSMGAPGGGRRSRSPRLLRQGPCGAVAQFKRAVAAVSIAPAAEGLRGHATAARDRPCQAFW